MKIAITGEKGFVGIHLMNYFRHILKYEVIELGRDYLSKLSDLKELDWLIHGAFLHRSSDPNEIKEKIVKAIQNQNWIKSVALENYNLAKRYVDFNTNQQKIVALYHQIENDSCE